MSKQEEIERVARVIALRRGFNPDALAATGKPYFINGGYVLPNVTIAVWQLFASEAAVAVEAVDRVREGV